MPAARRAPDSPLTRKRRFLRWMRHRFLLRFHMAVILGLTLAAGLLVSRVFLVQGNTDLVLRYGVAVVASYLSFLVLIWIWLGWVGGSRPDLDDAEAVADAAETVTEGDEMSAGGIESLLDVPDEPEGCLVAVAVALLVLVATAAGAALFLVWTAPAVLAEIAFEALLAPTLYRGVRGATATGWLGTAVRGTVLPFVVTLVVAVGFGAFAGRACPDARRLLDVVACARHR